MAGGRSCRAGESDMKCVILQPSYIPWRGYFHQIQKADVFVFYDDVQYDRDGWRNRNRIKGPHGPQWLTIPVSRKGSVVNRTPIASIAINWDTEWNTRHWKTLQQVYARAPYFRECADWLEPFYRMRPQLLTDFVIELTTAISDHLGIHHVQFLRSSSLGLEGQKTDRVLSVLQRLKATHYISGPSARDYIEREKFLDAGISLEYMSYDYREYPQLYPPFYPHCSVLDLMFMTGSAAGDWIWGERGLRQSPGSDTC